jgi:hypothetical protein
VKTVVLDNDWEMEYVATRKNATTGVSEPATGLTGLVGKLSATDGGATIHATLSVTLTERGTTGIYFGVLQGDDLRTQLAGSFLGQVVYEVFGDGTNILTSVPRLVSAVRRP